MIKFIGAKFSKHPFLYSVTPVSSLGILVGGPHAVVDGARSRHAPLLADVQVGSL